MEAVDAQESNIYFSFKAEIYCCGPFFLIFFFLMIQGTLWDLMYKEMSLMPSAFPIIDDGVSTLECSPR